METHYTILEIQDTATPEEIKDSYRLLLQVWHPDRFHHRPALLKKAEEKSGKINVAFETLSDPVLKQQYDDWLRLSGGRNTKTVESVMCPSCHTTIRPAHAQGENWDAYQRRRHATEEHNPTASATGQGNQPFPRAKTAILAIGALFTLVIVFVLTKPSKIRISNKPPQAVAQESRPEAEPLAGNEMDSDSHAETVQEGTPSSPAQADDQTAPSRETPPTTPQREGLDRLALAQRLMAKAPVRVQAPPGAQGDFHIGSSESVMPRPIGIEDGDRHPLGQPMCDRTFPGPNSSDQTDQRNARHGTGTIHRGRHA